MSSSDDPRGQSPSGLPVINLIAGSPAELAGIRPNDLVVELNGAPVTDIPSFIAARSLRNDIMEVRVLRGEATLTFTIRLRDPDDPEIRINVAGAPYQA